MELSAIVKHCFISISETFQRCMRLWSFRLPFRCEYRKLTKIERFYIFNLHILKFLNAGTINNNGEIDRILLRKSILLGRFFGNSKNFWAETLSAVCSFENFS